MPTRAASTADEIADNIKSLIERVADAKLTQEMSRRSQEMAEAIADRGSEIWRDTRPLRNDAAKRATRASRDASRWSDRTWHKSLRPALKDLWKQRVVAYGAAGAAVPAGKELVDTAAVRLGIRQEERHWGSFFLGLVLGAIGGAIVALLLAPKRGTEMRQELASRADEMVTKARDAEWVPMFQRDEPTNGQPSVAETTGAVTEGIAEAGSASGERAEAAADETAEAINESYDGVDREAAT